MTNFIIVVFFCTSLAVAITRCLIKVYWSPLWVDELLTLWVSNADLPTVLDRMYSGVDGQLPFVYLSYWAGYSLYLTEPSLRALTALLSFLAVLSLGVFLRANCKYSWQSILVSLGIFFLFSLSFFTSLSDIRGYSLFLSSFIFSFITINMLDQDQSKKNILLNGLAQGIFLNSHPFALFFSTGLALAFLAKAFYFRSALHIPALFLSYLLAGMLALPIIPSIISAWDLTNPPWYPTVKLQSLLAFLINSMPRGGQLALLVTIVALPVTCQRISTKPNAQPAYYALSSILVGVALWCYSLQTPLALERYFIPLLACNVVIITYIMSHYKITIRYLSICIPIIALILYSTYGNPIKPVWSAIKWQDTADSGVHDNLLLSPHGQNLILAADISPLLPRIRYNFYQMKHYAITDDPRLHNQAGTVDKITDRLILQGYPITRLTADQVDQMVRKKSVKRIVLFPNRMSVKPQSEAAQLEKILMANFVKQELNNGQIVVFTAQGYPEL
jgi:hypothetical protein